MDLSEICARLQQPFAKAYLTTLFLEVMTLVPSRRWTSHQITTTWDVSSLIVLFFLRFFTTCARSHLSDLQYSYKILIPNFASKFGLNEPNSTNIMFFFYISLTQIACKCAIFNSHNIRILLIESQLKMRTQTPI